MKTTILAFSLLLSLASCKTLSNSGISKKDMKKDIELVTTEGIIILRLYDDTPSSRNNFLNMVNKGMYDSILFHRVIQKFMIQAGERLNEETFKKKKDIYEFKDLVPAEITSTHFHKRGALGAAREGDDANPEQQGSFIQFYIVQGRTYTDSTLDIAEKRINKGLAYNHVINDPANETTFTKYQELREKRDSSNEEAIKQLKSELDSLTEIEEKRMTPYRYPEANRDSYKRVGGAAHLDQNYTVFGEVICGMNIVDRIAASKTNDSDRPLDDILILKTRLIKRQK